MKPMLYRLPPLLAFLVVVLCCCLVLAGLFALQLPATALPTSVTSYVLIAALVLACSGGLYFFLARDAAARWLRLVRTVCAALLAPLFAAYLYLFIEFLFVGLPI